MTYSDFIVFADESGDPNLKSIDPNFPVFVFNCCIFRRQDYYTKVQPAVANLKNAHFGAQEVILHARSIARAWRNPYIKSPFAFGGNRQKAAQFMDDLNRVIEQADFTVIAALIDLEKFQRMYPATRQVDLLAFRQCLGRLHDFLYRHGQHEQKTPIILESRGKSGDAGLRLEYRAARSASTPSGPNLPNLEIKFEAKSLNTAGVQLADLSASPIGPHYLHPERDNRAWNIISPKMFRSPQGKINGWGLIPYP